LEAVSVTSEEGRHVTLRVQRQTKLLLVALVFGMPAITPVPSWGRGNQQTPDAAAEVVDYRIGPGDVLELVVWKEADLTRDVAVRADGKATVPLIGDIEATGRTSSQLASEITKALTRFVSAPQVTVSVKVAQSARFYVLGQVAKPGDFPLTGRTTVIQGLALAGGFKEFAHTESIVIVRQDRGVSLPKGRPSESLIQVNYKKLEDGKDLSQNVVLRPGDTILVP
jgi:polysaccharide biosynthesis/export protein